MNEQPDEGFDFIWQIYPPSSREVSTLIPGICSFSVSVVHGIGEVVSTSGREHAIVSNNLDESILLSCSGGIKLSVILLRKPLRKVMKRVLRFQIPLLKAHFCRLVLSTKRPKDVLPNGSRLKNPILIKELYITSIIHHPSRSL